MSAAKSKRGPVQEDSPESGKGRSKKRRVSSDEHDDDEDSRCMTGPSKLSKDVCYRHNGMRTPAYTQQNKPAELFRKDLISAMKLADSEQLQPEEYLLIQDPWRQDWEKGVQVPVNPALIHDANIKVVSERPKVGDFKMPRKFLHATQDETYKQGLHELTGMQQLAEQVVRYDLDDFDACWLKMVNEAREETGEVAIYEWTMERIMEELEKQCHEKMEKTIKTEEGLGIEYDEDVICDVCRSPESEENNEMVFCDGCDICVHQACYGIQTIPEGSWLCRTCALGIKPTCILCPKSGGAMKSTKSGTKWSHVSCALWIPEVSIGCVEKMEPITKISQIPVSRWALVCCLCKERTGACIQCSVKTCKTAFHVTCGIANNLDMKTILDDSDEEDGVKLKAFCPKHTKGRDRTMSDSDLDSPCKEGSPRKDLTKEEREGLRKDRLKQLEDQFYTLIDLKRVADALNLPLDVIDIIFTFWKLKRKSLFDRPLLTPKTEEAEILEKQQEDSLVARMKMFVHLRQDLERVRNLCYMVSKREKMKRSYFKLRENVFLAQVKTLTQGNISAREVNKVKRLYHDRSVYGKPRPQPQSSSADEAPSTSHPTPVWSFSREGTPLSSCSATSEPEVRKSSRRRILSPKLRDMHAAFSDTGSQDGSLLGSEDAASQQGSVASSEDTASNSGSESETSRPRDTGRRKLLLNGRLSRPYRHRRKLHIADQPDVNPSVKTEIVEEDMELLASSEQTEKLPRGNDAGSVFSSMTNHKASPVTRAALRSDKISPSSESDKTFIKQEDPSYSNSRDSSPKRRVKSHVHQNSLLGHRNKVYRNVRKTRQSSASPESTENKPENLNSELRQPKDKTPVTHRQSVEKHIVPVSPTSENIKKELKDVLEKSQLVVDEKIREEVQERLLKSAGPKLYMNGLQGKSPRRHDSVYDSKLTRSNMGSAKRPMSFSQALTPTKVSNTSKVLNEISPTYGRSGVENKDWYGTNTSPRGSLSGYRIPKKSNRTPSQSPADPHDSTTVSSPLTPGVLETRSNIRRKIESDMDKTMERDQIITRSRESTPEKSDSINRRLTRSHGHENMEEVLTGRSRAGDSLQLWSSGTG
ncbi:protein Jade-1-like [Liolophura sinensis]|uniref:protein Jade-1-like n=1 Tax=Liolophura sinensis TaxID=3198878 RepID=UPI003158D61C